LNGLNHPSSNARGEKGGGASGSGARQTIAPARTANSLKYLPRDAAVVSHKQETEKLAFGERLKSLAQAKLPESRSFPSPPPLPLPPLCC
jgi:hypothetical protein